ncbi:MAG TPA: multidrug efflux RND transporter permease subunit [Saprospiraceae bacterium]|nr:multidrug efflux RND transporter permease subunit [Saprospiraceae bacterium]
MSEFFIRRPIVAMVISIFTIIFGLLVLRGIPVSQYPDITPPVVKITGTYSGANAVNVEQTVTTPIEQQVNGVEEMLYMRSINANDGTTTIEVSFEVGTNLDNANMLTQNRVSIATPSLPAEVKAMGITTKKSLTFPLMIVSLYSPNGTYDAQFINNYSFIRVVDRIKRISGVGDVIVFGGSEYSMRIWLKPDKMNALGIDVNDVKNALNEYNAIAPGGSFGANPALPGVQNTYTAQLQGRLVTEKEFADIVLKSKENGALVRMSDVARIELGTETYFQTSRISGKPASAILVYQIPGSNGLDIVEKVRKEMEEIKTQFPQDMDYVYSLDTTKAVEAGIEEIIHTLFEAIGLVLIVMFLFLQDWRATLIPLITVPVSLIGTFMFFPMLGFSVNVLSLLGLVLAIGLVVDDAIVVVEAVMHNLEHGMSPVEATRKAMKEVGGPVVAIAIVLAAVFVPVALTGGITGRLYQQFAITIAVSVALSAFNALTLSPALAALLLKPKTESKGLLARFFGAFNRGFDWFTDRYIGITGFFARKLLAALLALALIVGGAVYFASRVPGGFVPEEDEGYFIMSVMLPDAASFERTDAVTRRVEELLKEQEGVESYTVINGYNILSSTVSPNSGTLFVQLKNWSLREHLTVKDILRQVNFKVASQIGEATVLAVGPPPIPGLGSSAGFTLQLQDLTGQPPQYLADQARKVVVAAKERPEIGNAYTLFRANVPQKSIQVDKDKVEKLGLRLADVNSAISAMLGSSFVNNFNAFGRQYRTYIQADAPFRMKPDDLSQFHIRGPKGDMIPLNTLATVKDTVGPLYTNRFNLFRSAEISGTPADGYSSAQALAALEEVVKTTLPPDMGYSFSNMSFQEKAASGKSAVIFGMALLFVFLILAAQYESWSLPISVLLGTPWAVMGAMMGLYLSRLNSDSYVNNVFAQIGLVLLIGLNAKNAILIVEFAKMRYDEGATALEAALEGAKLRFRPILMTSFAFILGVVPLITASGAGAEARKVMGMAVFAGMITATILGCILIPAMYVLIQGKKRKTPAVKPETDNDKTSHA